MQQLPSKCLSVDFKRPIYLWNLMIRNSHSKDQTLNIYSCMLRSNVHGNNFTLPLVLKSCDSLANGKSVHCHAFLTGFQSEIFVQTSLIHMYSTCFDLASARQVFDEMPLRNVISWNCVLSAYTRDHLMINEAFTLLNEMFALGLAVNSSTLASIVSSGNCTLRQGMSIHCCAVKLGLLNCDVPLANSIINMYGKFARLDEARSVFDSMDEKSIVSWTTIIGGYVNSGNVVEALYNFSRMRRQTSIGLDYVIFANIISGCAQVGNLSFASSVHSLVLKIGCDFVDPIDNLLVSMYAKCGDIISARRVFDSVHNKDIFLWTSLISGYTQSGRCVEALDLFRTLLKTGLKPNEQTIATVFSACADLGSLKTGKEIAEYIYGLESNRKSQTSMIHMFCKCGSIIEAKKVFDKIQNKDVAAFSCMINGYAIHGMGEEAFRLFRRMQRVGLQPDASVLTSVLLACSHSGLVEDGLKYFQTMREKFGIEPTVEHYTCLVDLLGRAGCFELALKTICELPVELQASVYAPLLSACKKHGNVKLGEYVAEKLLELNPGSTGNYVLMANLYASAGKWNEAARMRSLIDRRRLIKEPGWSQVEIDGLIYLFVAGNRSHCRSDEIYKKLEELDVKLRDGD